MKKHAVKVVLIFNVKLFWDYNNFDDQFFKLNI